jgi:hypothetical protein
MDSEREKKNEREKEEKSYYVAQHSIEYIYLCVAGILEGLNFHLLSV